METLDSLHAAELWFTFKERFEQDRGALSPVYRHYYAALVDNAFYQHAASNRTIDRLLEKGTDGFSGEKRMNIHRAKYLNHYNLFEYSDALEQCSLLIADYEAFIDSAAFHHLLNDRKMLGVLTEVPAQRVKKQGDSHIDLVKDKMGLLNIALQVNGDTIDFLFDTGSSTSFIRRSIAEAIGMEIHDVDFEVEGATGQVVICDVAVMDRFTIGQIGVEHAVFWVFDDRDVTLPEYDYAVNGAIAFPILRSLEEFHIVFNQTLFVPETPKPYHLENLAITGLDPVIAVFHDGDTLPFYYDTGSAFSSFYRPWYVANAAMVDTTYEQKEFNIGSLGGVRGFRCYIIDSTELAIDDRRAMIHDVEAHTAPIYRDAEKVYGNLGQDFFLQFEKMVISTRYASVFLE